MNLGEAFEYKKAKLGELKFPSSTLRDPFLQKIVAMCAQAQGKPVQEILAGIEFEIAEMTKTAKLAPVLYHTALQNAAENNVFNVFWKTPVKVDAPEFNTVTFMKLVRSIRADNDEFLPLRGFLDVRRVANPEYLFEDDKLGPDAAQRSTVNTAAATPSGKFIFNTNFMQKLLDWGALKGVKGNGKKYVSQGGDIPDPWCYIEFLIMHEYMHYSNDDFYYQHIIPKAKQKIINWVGDFRTNYLLVKSGYTPLPIGLYNDKINYDRQKSYVEMYNLVKSEFDKLPKDFQDIVSEMLDRLSDDHEPGQEEGEEVDISDREATPEDIDRNEKRIEKQMDDKKDSTPEERNKPKANKSQEGSGGKPGKGGNANVNVDYTKVAPTFNWKTLVKKFITSAVPRPVETYAAPARRGVTNVHVARQRGAAAIKPAERPGEHGDSKIGFCFDSSGSMSGVIAKVYANALNLLKQPQFAKTDSFVFKFSSGYNIYRVNFASNRAAEIKGINDKPKNYNLKTTDIFSKHLSGGTDFDASLSTAIQTAMKGKTNIIFFLDSDILHGTNLANFTAIVKAFPRQTFVVFDTRDTYVRFRQATGISTPGLTYFG